jgi:hypothetical protein
MKNRPEGICNSEYYQDCALAMLGLQMERLASVPMGHAIPLFSLDNKQRSSVSPRARRMQGSKQKTQMLHLPRIPNDNHQRNNPIISPGRPTLSSLQRTPSCNGVGGHSVRAQTGRWPPLGGSHLKQTNCMRGCIYTGCTQRK